MRRRCGRGRRAAEHLGGALEKVPLRSRKPVLCVLYRETAERQGLDDFLSRNTGMFEAVVLPFFAQQIDNEKGSFSPPKVQEDAAVTMLDELLKWATALSRTSS